jgi:hypothetical protein
MSRPATSRIFCALGRSGLGETLLVGDGPDECAAPIPVSGDNYPMGEREAAQADQLIRALCEVRDKTNRQLGLLGERASQLEAAALRRDINEAQAHITRLRCRYLGADAGAAPRLAPHLQRVGVGTRE